MPSGTSTSSVRWATPSPASRWVPPRTTSSRPSRARPYEVRKMSRQASPETASGRGLRGDRLNGSRTLAPSREVARRPVHPGARRSLTVGPDGAPGVMVTPLRPDRSPVLSSLAALHEGRPRLRPVPRRCRLPMLQPVPVVPDPVRASSMPGTVTPPPSTRGGAATEVVDECYQYEALPTSKCPYVPPHGVGARLPAPRSCGSRHSAQAPERGRPSAQARDRPVPRAAPSARGQGLVGGGHPSVSTGPPGRPGQPAPARCMEKAVGLGIAQRLPPYAPASASPPGSASGARPPQRHRFSGTGPGRRLDLPHLLHRVHGPRRRQGHGGGLRAQRGRPAALPEGTVSAVARPGCISGNVEQFDSAATATWPPSSAGCGPATTWW